VISLHDIDLAFVFERQAKRERNALDRRELPVKRAITLRVAGYVIEQYRRRSAAALFGEHMGDGAHFDVPMRARYAPEFTEPIDGIDPTAQTAIASVL
jgi:hypothetical protein